MSKMQQIDVECPECGIKQKVDYWDSINVDLDFSLRKHLFDGSINFFRCENCNYEAFVNGPMLYHDMTRKFCIQYLPDYWLEDLSKFESYYTDGSLETYVNFTSMGIDHLSKPHVVFNMEELLRYIVFRELLYDRDMADQKSVANLLN
jgi:hypothetical protein